MQISNSTKSKALLLIYVAAATLIIDQLSKAAARYWLSVDQPLTVIPGFIDLRLSFNRGAAFGLLPSFAPLFILMAIVVVYAIWKFRDIGTTKPLATALGLIMGGAMGNVLDRLITPARGVTDFIDLHLGAAAAAFSWPTFNVADAALVVGVMVLLLFTRTSYSGSEEARAE